MHGRTFSKVTRARYAVGESNSRPEADGVDVQFRVVRFLSPVDHSTIARQDVRKPHILEQRHRQCNRPAVLVPSLLLDHHRPAVGVLPVLEVTVKLLKPGGEQTVA